MGTHSGDEILCRFPRELNPVAFIQSCHYLALKVVFIAPASQSDVSFWGEPSVHFADSPGYSATV